jgi:hypothetical protein
MNPIGGDRTPQEHGCALRSRSLDWKHWSCAWLPNRDQMSCHGCQTGPNRDQMSCYACQTGPNRDEMSCYARGARCCACWADPRGVGRRFAKCPVALRPSRRRQCRTCRALRWARCSAALPPSVPWRSGRSLREGALVHRQTDRQKEQPTNSVADIAGPQQSEREPSCCLHHMSRVWKSTHVIDGRLWPVATRHPDLSPREDAGWAER